MVPFYYVYFRCLVKSIPVVVQGVNKRWHIGCLFVACLLPPIGIFLVAVALAHQGAVGKRWPKKKVIKFIGNIHRKGKLFPAERIDQVAKIAGVGWPYKNKASAAQPLIVDIGVDRCIIDTFCFAQKSLVGFRWHPILPI